MLDALTGPEVAATAKMMRASFRGTILIVEGPSDHLFLERFIDKNACELLPAHGKHNALGAISTLRKEGALNGTLAFVDADFARISAELPDDDSIIVSDHHDVEMMMFLSPAAEKVVREFGSSAKVPSFSARVGCASVIEHILGEAAKIGHVRLASRQKTWNLRFKDIEHRKFTDCRTALSVDEDDLARVVLANSGPVDTTHEEVRAVVPERSPHHYGDICCGHDCSALLALGLRSCLGSQPPQVAKRENIEKVLRIGYEEAYWQSTEAHAAFVEWEGRNAPFHVLRRNGAPDSS